MFQRRQLETKPVVPKKVEADDLVEAKEEGCKEGYKEIGCCSSRD